MDKEIEDTLEYFKKQCLGNMDIFKSQFGKDSMGYIFNNELLSNLNSIKQALTTKSKKEKAFDIANKKCVDMYRLEAADNVVSYNKWVEFDEYMLTEEEFDLLKEVLNDNSQE
jgi:hypothetical protein